MRQLNWFGMVVVVGRAVMACDQDAGAPATDEIGESEIQSNANADVLTEAESGRTVTVGEGKDVVVELPSRAASRASGYAWRVVATNKNFGYPATTELVVNSEGTGDGVERFVWKTRGPLSLIGQHAVKLELRRPPPGSGLPHEEASEVPATDTFRFTVKIVAGDGSRGR